MKNNILSMGQILVNGYDINMKNLSLSTKYGKYNLVKNVQMLRNIMFLLNIQNEEVTCIKACIPYNGPLIKIPCMKKKLTSVTNMMNKWV